MEKIAPKKSLGQNFLTNVSIAERIVNLLGDVNSKTVLEIGPGMGVLTDILLKKNANLTCVELDKRAFELLSKKYKSYDYFNLINQDILKFSIDEFAKNNDGKRFSVIGNIPYNISTEIFFMLFENAKYIDQAVLTVQKEVAQRIAATTKQSKNYGISTLARAMTSNAKIAFDIAGASFFPPPKVTSSVIKLDFFEEQPSFEEYSKLMKLVRASFSQRRKVLNNSLSTYLNSLGIDADMLNERLSEANLNYLRQRAEELTLEDYRTLLRLIETALK